ncbi:unnamed protein product [Calicophoron daubneyi]|uniref:Malectin domain-containing protein n=1 Tax=Calicophoron daubneyi TaxID=300641 RepID=A0AAV2TYI2_CALDB
MHLISAIPQMVRWFQLFTAVCFCLLLLCRSYYCEVVWAVNCGGGSHVDVNGIQYMADPLRIGTSSDYGRSFIISRVPTEDQILYQTEHYHTDGFSYDVPFVGDGNYVLTLKFSEVWFTDPNQKVFHIKLNKVIPIVEDLDIFAEVGFATALDVNVPLKISNGVIYAAEQTVNVAGNSFSVDFIKTDRDNPKINAIILTKGTIDDVPQLPPMEETKPIVQPTPKPTQEELGLDNHRRRPTGVPRAPDPYATTEYSYLILPVLATLAAFVPLVFCLCKI